MSSGEKNRDPLPRPPMLELDPSCLGAIRDRISTSEYEHEEALRRLLIDAFENFRYGLRYKNYVVLYAIEAVARFLRDSIDPGAKALHPKEAAFLHGARLGKIALDYHFNFAVPELTNEACAAYGLHFPTTETTAHGVAMQSNSSLEEGWLAYSHNPVLEQLINEFGGPLAVAEPATLQAGSGYPVFLVSHAVGFRLYQTAQSPDLDGVFDNLKPEDFAS